MSAHALGIRSTRFLHGPNVYAPVPVMEAIIEMGAYADGLSCDVPGFVERLTAWLPGLAAHACSSGPSDPFMEHLTRGTGLAHVVAHVTLELQRQVEFPVSFGRTEGTSEHGVYSIVVAYGEEEPARSALEIALRLVGAALADQPFELAGELQRLLELADKHRLVLSATAIVEAARLRDIPALRLTPPGQLVQLGWGVHQKRIQVTETSHTSALTLKICKEKTLTNRLLSALGVPVPAGRAVASADAAWEAAQEVGLPVVVKPRMGHKGVGVSVNLTTEEQVRAAYTIAEASIRAGTFRGGVMVEQHIAGRDHRLLVVNGALVAAARRDPAEVVGDGQRTVRELVALVNRDPRRRPHHSPLSPIKLDEAATLALRQQGMAFDSVPAPGQAVRLRSNSNLSSGGTATDVTDEVHPGTARLVELAAQIVALDVAGVDIVCRDIRRPLAEQGGAIVEVNANPSLRMHLYPTQGRSRPVGRPIVEMLYPLGAPGRIPLLAITGNHSLTTVTRVVAHIYETAGRVVGVSTADGAYGGGERIVAGDSSGFARARAVLRHPWVEVAVLETAPEDILREGLAFDRCQVGVVVGSLTGAGPALAARVVVAAVARDGAAVLNADDPLVAELAAATEGEVVYYSLGSHNLIVHAHRARGGRCVFVRSDQIVLAQGRTLTALLDVSRVVWTADGTMRLDVQSILAATAAAAAAGLDPAVIAHALSSFSGAARTATAPVSAGSGYVQTSERTSAEP